MCEILMCRHLVKPRARATTTQGPAAFGGPWLTVEAVGGDHVIDCEPGLAVKKTALMTRRPFRSSVPAFCLLSQRYVTGPVTLRGRYAVTLPASRESGAGAVHLS
jgi:hypothetical protein